jgi:hypothetical protein
LLFIHPFQHLLTTTAECNCQLTMEDINKDNKAKEKDGMEMDDPLMIGDTVPQTRNREENAGVDGFGASGEEIPNPGMGMDEPMKVANELDEHEKGYQWWLKHCTAEGFAEAICGTFYTVVDDTIPSKRANKKAAMESDDSKWRDRFSSGLGFNIILN